MFGRILVAVDDDALIGQVVTTAAELALSLRARLALVHVTDPARMAALATLSVAPLATDMGAFAMGVCQDEAERAGRITLERAAAALPVGTVAELLLRRGPSWAAILAAAREWDAAVIVVGTHGRSGVIRLTLGSVTERVLREAPCPVRIVRDQC